MSTTTVTRISAPEVTALRCKCDVVHHAFVAINIVLAISLYNVFLGCDVLSLS